MAGITLGSGAPTLRSLVQSYVFQGSTDTGLVTAQQLDDFINLAHRKLYNEMAELTPTLFAVRSADVSSATGGKYDFGGTTLDANTVHRVNGVELKYSGEYSWLRPVHFTERSWPSTNVSAPGRVPRNYAILGTQILLHPEPTDAQTLRITYVPGIGLLANTTDQPFNGNFTEFHELVALYAAVRILEKDRRAQYLLPRLTKELDDMKAWCRRRQAQRGRNVIESDVDDPYLPPF